MAVGPGAFDEDAAGVRVAGLGDGAEAAGGAGCVHAGDETDEGGKLPGGGEAGDVAGLGDGGDGDGVLHPPQGLEGFDERRQPPGGGVLPELGCESLEPGGDLGDGVEVLLEDDLLGGSGTDDPGDGEQACLVPVGPSLVSQTQPEQEG